MRDEKEEEEEERCKAGSKRMRDYKNQARVCKGVILLYLHERILPWPSGLNRN